MVEKSKSIRKTILFNEFAWAKLEKLVKEHESWIYRRNTIVQAAIIAFLDLAPDTRDYYLKEIHKRDGRWG